MKTAVLSLLLLLLLVACRKETPSGPVLHNTTILASIRSFLTDSLNTEELKMVNFNRYSIARKGDTVKAVLLSYSSNSPTETTLLSFSRRAIAGRRLKLPCSTWIA